ncbi:MAG: hypothetical protein LBK83_06085 [Treponema sp.]|jgi:hypothetical protein|nr:hypothetical protein [Treponema sp.]
MKYTAKISQSQLAGGVKIEPRGGDLTEKQAEKIMADPWGKELIKMGLLQIAGVKAPDNPSSNNEKEKA